MARTANGRSSIYEGKDGYWHGRVTMGVKPDGSPDRRHVMNKKKTEVTKKVRDLEKERDSGLVAKAGVTYTVEQWMNEWITSIAPQTASESTITSTYRPKVEHWINPLLGKHKLKALQPSHIDAFHASLAKAGLKPKTILMTHQLLSRALKMAERRGLVGRNVAKLVDAPKLHESEIVPLATDEARNILATAPARRNGARWSVALALGLRQCEALGMRWEYLDLKAGTVRVYQLKKSRYQHGCDDPRKCAEKRHRAACEPGCTKHKKKCPKPCLPTCTLHAAQCPKRTGGDWDFREPKGGKARTVTIPTPLRAVLKHQKAAQAKERLVAGELWEEKWDLVFAQSNGRPISARDDWDNWKAICKSAGVRDARVHDARHTAATLLLEQGVDISVVQEILGHSTVTVTRKYAHVTKKLHDSAADAMGRVLWAN